MVRGVSSLSSCCFLAVFCVFLRPEPGHVMVRGVSSLSSCCFLAIFFVFFTPGTGPCDGAGRICPVFLLLSCYLLAVFCVFLRPEPGYVMVQGVSALSSCCLLTIFCVFLRPEPGHVMVKDVTTYKKEKRNPWIPEVPHIYKIQIISLRTEEHDELPLSRTSFFPSFEDLL